MPYPFLIWGAALFVVPAMGLAMGMVWAASMIGLLFAVTYAVLQIAKMVAQTIPVVRDFIPDEVPAEELSARRLEAEATAERVAAEIEAEIQAVAEETQVLLPTSAMEASALLDEAKATLHTARQQLEAAEAQAKEQSGGWMAVCDARERVSRAEADLSKAEAVARPLLLTSGTQNSEDPDAEVKQARNAREAAYSERGGGPHPLAMRMSSRSFSSVSTPLPIQNPAGLRVRRSPANSVREALPRAAFALRKALRR